MALGIRYSGSFYSLSGSVWRVNILQEGYGADEPQSLDFPANNQLEISWSSTDKINPLQRSSATLRVVSDTDRQFVDLYSVDFGVVRLDVYLDGELYWSGSLDTELYEEPYSFADGYDVTLTFSDFAPLERFKWTGSGLLSVKDIIRRCIERCVINVGTLDTSFISTAKDASSAPLSLDEVLVLQENFFDEDGKAQSYKEVLEGVLAPFALRLVQKAGKVWVYDLNGIYGQDPTNVQWDSDDSVLSADVVYNNARVTFSPYGSAKMMEGQVDEDKSFTGDSSEGIIVKVNYERNEYGYLSALDGFRIRYNTTLKSNMQLSGGAQFFQIRSIYSGDDETGVIATFKQGDWSVAEEDGASSKVKHMLLTPKDCGTISNGNVNSETLISCPRVFLGYCSYLRQSYRLRISLNLLFDVRYNPFEQEGDNNDNASWSSGMFNWNKHDGPYQNMQDWCNFGYVPIKLTLQDSSGNALYHLVNRGILDSSGYDRDGRSKWAAGEAAWGDAYLCYYDFDDRKSKTGFGGWRSNKQMIGYYRDALPEKWKSIKDGEYVDLPPVGGYLVLEIGSGIHQFDYKREVKDIYKYCRWVMYKKPSITLCHKNYIDAETEDVEDSGWLNKAAKEEYALETVVGTLPQSFGVPNAKGQVFNAEGMAYSKFTRAGITDRLERLLMGTMYSQYASRHNVLSGTVRLLPGFGLLSDEGRTPGKFLLLSEHQQCRENVSEIKMSELSEEEYEGIETK